eukprot:2383263-Pyramimonas_sp.AAC.1
MSEATRRSGERIHGTLASRWGRYVMGGDAGVGRARCGVRTHLCYGMTSSHVLVPLPSSFSSSSWEDPPPP